MSSRIFVATKKGLFTVKRQAGKQSKWEISHIAFLGDPVSAVLPDSRDGSIYAALNLGHFGVKLHRSTDGGENWEECVVPIYPKQSEAYTNQSEDGSGNSSSESLKQI